MSAASETIPAISWAEANDAYIRTELHRLRLLFARKVRWLRRNWQTDPIGINHSLVISDALADRLLSGDDETEESRFYHEDAECSSITNTLKELDAELAKRRQKLTDDGSIPALEVLARSFNLKPIERDLLMMCFAIDEEPSFGTLAGYLQDNMNARYVTCDLVLSALCQSREDHE